MQHRLPLRIIILILSATLLWACQKSEPEKQDKTEAHMPESFTFLGIGANTVIDGAAREKLRRQLGPEGEEPRTTIRLDMKYEGFLSRYYPDLAALNNRLNIHDAVRKAHAATKLTYRNTHSKGAVFDYVELIFDNASQMPLVIKIISKQDIQELLNTITQKYGPAKEIPLDGGKGVSYSWQRQNDRFIITRFPGRYQDWEYYMMIVYLNRLDRLLAGEAEAQRQVEESRQKAGEKAF